MKKVLLGCASLLIGASAALADGKVITSRTINSNDYKPRQRFVCVVPPQASDNRSRPYTCRAPEGRVGGTCRCDGVVGSGRLDLAG